MCCSPDGDLIARSSVGTLQIVDTKTGQVRCENNIWGSVGSSMEFHPDGCVLFAAAFDSSIRLWDTRTGRELLSLRGHDTTIHSLQITPDGNRLISADRTGKVLRWDLTYYNDRIRRELEFRVSLPDDP
jgi:WD40 repeat protein